MDKKTVVIDMALDLEDLETLIEETLDEIERQRTEIEELTAWIKELEKNCIYDPSGKIFVPDGHPELERLRTKIKDLEDTLKQFQEI